PAAIAPVAGTYTVRVQGAVSTAGSYSLDLLAGAAPELEVLPTQTRNNTLATAQNLDSGFATDATGLGQFTRTAVLGATGTGTAARNIFWQVIGSGANQQLVVQWNNVRRVSGNAFFTFQAILSVNGTVPLNYASTLSTSSIASNATVGVKAPGTVNPQRL